MGSPLVNGWYKKSFETEAALDFADLSMLARTLLRYAFMQLYGPGQRPEFAILCCSEIAGRIGAHPTHVARARRELIASSVIIPANEDKNAFFFVEDYERWTQYAVRKSTFYPINKQRLTPPQIADCKAAPAYAMGFANAKETDRPLTPADLSGQVLETNSGLGHETNSGLDDETNFGLPPRPTLVSRPDQLWSASETNSGLESSPPYKPLLGRDSENREKEQEPLGSSETVATPKPEPAAPALTPLDRLIAWVRERILAAEFPPETVAAGESLCRRWAAKGGDLERCAEAFQAGLDAQVLDLASYVQKILVRLFNSHKAGEPVDSPAICDFRVDPAAPLGGMAPTPKQTIQQRRSAEAAARREAFHRAFPGKEAADVQD